MQNGATMISHPNDVKFPIGPEKQNFGFISGIILQKKRMQWLSVREGKKCFCCLVIHEENKL